MLRVCLLLVFVCVVGAGGLSGRGFFCRDPDTGKLYPVNTTWPSSSFCGNYHCKLRRKNLTESAYPPIRQINVSRLNILGENFTRESILNETISLKKEEVEDSVISTDKKTEPDILNDIQDLLPFGKTRENVGQNLNDMIKTERDRYLTDQEIKSISEILHTVKKSDLDAIVEIYNLAQDIYKEIDKTSTERDTSHVLDETLYSAKAVKGTKNKPGLKNVLKNHVSYWYEPLSNGKIRPIEQLRSDLTRSEVVVRNDVNSALPPIVPDMEVQSSNIVQVASTQPTTRVPAPVAVSPAPRIRQMTDTYFNGPLSSKDFGKLPYYYPLSNFQRLSSYVHPPAPKMPIPIIPIPKPSFKPITYRPQYYVGGKYQKEIKPSILLPYPFSYIRHYNWSHPQNLYHSKKSKIEYDITKKVTANVNTYVNKFNNAVLMNPDLENFQDLEVKQQKRKDDKPPYRPPMIQKIKEENRRPDWKTDPLPKHVIEEVRARVEDKTRIMKPFPLRKKVKIERVGKVIKMDELSRSKRSFDQNSATLNDERLEPELYEVYIERTTCHADYSVPGYFRYGNLSEPFPNCCPQRISAR